MSDLATLLRRGRNIRTLGIDDAPFERGQRQNVRVFGVVCSGIRFEGLLSTHVRPDGFNATRRLIECISGSKFLDQLHAVLIDGITLAGFNVVDLPALNQALQIPVIAVMRQHPDFEKVYEALNSLTSVDRRRAIMDRGGPIHRASNASFQVHGAVPEIAEELLDRLTDTGHIPEPLRLAHLIGRGVVLGESGRRA